MKKLVAMTMILAMTIGAVGCGSSSSSSSDSSESSATPAESTTATETETEPENAPVNSANIGISQFAQHGSLDNCREGILIGLAENGYVEGENLTFSYENAGSDMGTATQIAQNFSAQNVDVMVAIATPSAMAAYAAAEDKDIPVVFTAITDPVEANLDSGNVTGTSDKLPVEQQLQLIREMQPDAETIGIIYTTSEPNSVSAITEYESIVGEYGFTLSAIGVTQQSEVLLATDNIIAQGVDAISNLTDNTVVDVLPSILEKTDEAGIPVYGSEIEQVVLGCVAAAGIDYLALGVQTGGMIAKILSGESAASEMPYETISESEIYMNTTVAEEKGLEIPSSIEERMLVVD
ncbi:MAG: ABC transporter substrate-binding protein [Bacillota bacterium]